MTGDKDYAEVVIPAGTATYTIVEFMLRPGDFEVTLICTNEEGVPHTIMADMAAVWAGMSELKKADVNDMFKKMVSVGLGIPTTEVIGDLWI